MKLIKYLFIFSLVSVLALSCDKGLDPIIEVAPKPDAADPQLAITYPIEGKPFVSPDEIATMTFKLVASDDIELKSVVLKLNGAEIASFTEFKDYRRLDLKYDYDLASGDYVLDVIVTDLTGKSVTGSVSFRKITAPTYTPLDGEVAYFPLDGYYLDLISGNALTIVGTPGFAEGKLGEAYAGATDAYLTYPSAGVAGNNLSAVFWYKLNDDPARAGIFMISHPAASSEDRFKGLRFSRELDGAGPKQKFWMNIGNGTIDTWVNPPSFEVTGEWMHIALIVSDTNAMIYINGEIAAEAGYEGPIDWTDCPSISLMSGEPNVIYWEHYSDLSLLDELHLFNRVITAAEVQSFYAVK